MNCARSSWGTAFISWGVDTDRATLALSVEDSGRDQVMTHFLETGGLPGGPDMSCKSRASVTSSSGLPLVQHAQVVAGHRHQTPQLEAAGGGERGHRLAIAQAHAR